MLALKQAPLRRFTPSSYARIREGLLYLLLLMQESLLSWVSFNLLWDNTDTLNLAHIPIFISPLLPQYSHGCWWLLGSPSLSSPRFTVFCTSPYLDHRPRLTIHLTSHAQSHLHTCRQTSRTCPLWHVPYLSLQAFHKHSRQIPDVTRLPALAFCVLAAPSETSAHSNIAQCGCCILPHVSH